MKYTTLMSPAVILCITFLSIREADSFGPLSLFEVFVGAIEVYNFLQLSPEEPQSNRTFQVNVPLDWNLISHVENIYEIVRDLPEDFRFAGSMDQMKESFMMILNHRNDILDQKRSLKIETKITPQRLEDYQRYADHTLRELIGKKPLLNIHQIVRDTFRNYTSYRYTWLEQYQAFANICVTRLSPLQAVGRLLEHVVWSSRLYYEIILIAHHILDDTKGRGYDVKLANNYKRQISTWYNDTIRTIAPVLTTMSRKLYACGQPFSTSSKDYAIELKVFSKVFVRLHNDFNTPDKIKCTSISQPKECSPKETTGSCSISRTCEGKFYGCESINDMDYEVCVSDSPKSQRYQYYKNSSTAATTNIIYGKCNLISLKTKSNWEWLHRYDTFSVRVGDIRSTCSCTCEEGEYFINLAPVYSEVSDNMVITGAQFVLEKNVLELHIQQAELLPNGQIDSATEKWIGPQWEALQKVSRHVTDKILLSTTMLPPGRVLTGLKLDYGTANDFKNEHSYIFLRIFSNGYDFKKGHVTNDKPQIEGLRTAFPHTELDLTNLISPKRSEKIKEEFVRNDVWVTLGTSNGLDGGQSTIPFFDGQEVTSDRPIPLSGAGLYYKGGKYWAGYIGIELHTYDMSKFITADPDAK